LRAIIEEFVTRDGTDHSAIEKRIEKVMRQLDAGLVEVNDVREWTAQGYGLPTVGELADLNVEIKISETRDKRDYHISSEKILKVLGYKPVSSIQAEVANLRKALEGGAFPDIDAPEHYNMKFMKIERNSAAYDYLSR